MLKIINKSVIKYIGPLIILTGFTLYFAHDIYSIKKALFHTDICTYYYPFRQWFSQRLLKGEFPLWNPFFGIGNTALLWGTIPMDIYTMLEIIFGAKYHYFQTLQVLLILLASFYAFLKLGFKPIISTVGALLFFMSPWVTYFWFYFMKANSYISFILLFLFLYQWIMTEEKKHLFYIIWTVVFSMFGTKPEFWFYQTISIILLSVVAGLLYHRYNFAQTTRIVFFTILSLGIGILIHSWQINLTLRVIMHSGRSIEHGLYNLFSKEMYSKLFLSIYDSSLLKLLSVGFLCCLAFRRKKLFSWIFLLSGTVFFFALKMWRLPIFPAYLKSPLMIGASLGFLISIFISRQEHWNWRYHLKNFFLYFLFVFYWCRPDGGDLDEVGVMNTATIAFRVLVYCLVWLGCTQFWKNKLVKLAYFSILLIFIIRDQGQILLAHLLGLLWIPTRDNYIIDFAVAIIAITGLSILESSIIQKFKWGKWLGSVYPISFIAIGIIIFSPSKNYYYCHKLVQKAPPDYPYYTGIQKVKKVIRELKNSSTTRIFLIPNKFTYTYDSGSSLLENISQVTLYDSFIPKNYREWSAYRLLGIKPSEKWGIHTLEYSNKTISRLPKINTLGYDQITVYLATVMAKPPIDKNILKLLGVDYVMQCVPRSLQVIRQLGMKTFLEEVKGVGLKKIMKISGLKYPDFRFGMLNSNFFIGKLNNPLDMAFVVSGVSQEKMQEFMYEMTPIVSDSNDSIGTKSHRFSLRQAKIKKYMPEYISVEAEGAGEEDYLVLSDLYHPYWHAMVDDKETGIIPAFYILRAVKIPPGRHHIVFYYKVPYFGVTVLFSLLVFFLSILAYCVLVFRKRK